MKIDDFVPYLGRTVLLRVRATDIQRQRGDLDLWFPVRLMAVDRPAGVWCCHVEPVGGVGRQWVSVHRIHFGPAHTLPENLAATADQSR